MADAHSPANAALIQEYLRLATVTDDMDRFSQLLASALQVGHGDRITHLSTDGESENSPQN